MSNEAYGQKEGKVMSNEPKRTGLKDALDNEIYYGDTVYYWAGQGRGIQKIVVKVDDDVHWLKLYDKRMKEETE